MERLTRRSKVGEGLPIKHMRLMHMDTTSEDTLTEILDKLADYEDAEEQGLLHRAPIPDGTSIFTLNDDDPDFFGYDLEQILETSYLYSHTEFVYGEINQGWFLTREAAEEALKLEQGKEATSIRSTVSLDMRNPMTEKMIEMMCKRGAEAKQGKGLEG